MLAVSLYLLLSLYYRLSRQSWPSFWAMRWLADRLAPWPMGSLTHGRTRFAELLGRADMSGACRRLITSGVGGLGLRERLLT